MRVRRVAAAVALLCLDAVAHAAPAPPRRATAVVADIGAGVNPYHEAFRRPGWTDSPARHVPGFPASARRLDLTLGDDWAASRAKDARRWAAYRENVLYWVPGTNLLLLTTRSTGFPPDGDPGTPQAATGLQRFAHGTGTAGAASAACPACYVLVIQDRHNYDGDPIHRIAASLPWVDLVVSSNFAGNEVDGLVSGYYPPATERLHASGRLFVAPTGNTPVTGVMPVPYPQIVLPRWVVAVGGSHRACRAAEVNSGKPADHTADFSQVLPGTGTVKGMVGSHGTSFAAPAAAGAFAGALVELRRAKGSGRARGYLWAGPGDPRSPYLRDGLLSQVELRDAMARSATYFTTAEYTPNGGLCQAPAPVSPTPWVELGWGHVGAAEATLAANVLLGRAAPPAKPDAARQHMASFEALRRSLYG